MPLALEPFNASNNVTSQNANHVCRFVAALAVGCAFGCARQAVYRQAMIYVFLEFKIGVDVAASASSAEYWHQFLTYWAPFVLLTSVEKIFITYADFQARLPPAAPVSSLC